MIFRHASLFLALALLAAATAQQQVDVLDYLEFIEVAHVNEETGSGSADESGDFLIEVDGDEEDAEEEKPPELWEIYPHICTECKNLLQEGKNSTTNKAGSKCKKLAKKQIQDDSKSLKRAKFQLFKPKCGSKEWHRWFKSGKCWDKKDDKKKPEDCKPNEMCHKAKLCPKPEENHQDECTVSGEQCHCCIDVVRASKEYAEESEEDNDPLDFCKQIVQGKLSVGEDGDEDGDEGGDDDGEDEEDQCAVDDFQRSDCRDWFGNNAESNKPKDLCVDTGYCTCSMSNRMSHRRKLGRAEPVYD